MRSTRTGSIRYHYTIALWLPDGRVVGGDGLITEPANLSEQELYRRVKRQASKDANVPEHDVVPLGYTIRENEPPRL